MDGNCQHLRPKPSALAGMTRPFLHKALNIAAHKITVGLFMASFQIRYYALKSRIKISAAAQLYFIGFTTGAIHQLVQLFFFNLGSRYMQ
jgi:hypothetical protein